MTIDPTLQSLEDAYRQCIVRMEGIEKRPDALWFLRQMRQTLASADSFRRELSRVLVIGDPGPTMTAELTMLEHESAAISAQMAQVETRLAEVEQAAQARDAEMKKLEGVTQRVAELGRALVELEELDAMAASEDRLRELVTDLETRVALTDTKQLLSRLNELAPAALQHSEEHEQELTQRLDKMLAALDASGQKLKQLDIKLQEARVRWDEQRSEMTAAREALDLYARADQDIAEAVPGASNVQEALNHVSRQLEGIDRALRTAIEANERHVRRRLTAVGFTGAPIHPSSSGAAEQRGGAQEGAPDGEL